MAKNLVSSQNLGPQIFFHGFYLYYMLDIVASYHCMQFQGKLIKQTREKSKKPKKLWFSEVFMRYKMETLLSNMLK